MNPYSKLVEALERISAMEYTLDAPMGDEARLHVCASIALAALEEAKRWETVENFGVVECEDGTAVALYGRPAILLIQLEANDE